MRIDGLEPGDVLLCDLLWSCDSQQAVDAMITALPPAHKQRAGLMVQLMTAAVWDDHMHVEDHVRDYLATL
jgi:hypothetical protein